MGKEALDIVRNFMADTGLSPQGTSLTNCIDFAYTVLQMEDDAKHTLPSMRNIIRYAEGKVDKSHRISHGTLYNDKMLNEMVNWYISVRSAGKNAKDSPRDLKKMEERIRRQRRQIEGLVQQQLLFDQISAECYRAKLNELRNKLLFDRAMVILKKYGIDHEIDMTVSPDDIGVVSSSIRGLLSLDKNVSQPLEQGYDDNTDVEINIE